MKNISPKLMNLKISINSKSTKLKFMFKGSYIWKYLLWFSDWKINKRITFDSTGLHLPVHLSTTIPAWQIPGGSVRFPSSGFPRNIWNNSIKGEYHAFIETCVEHYFLKKNITTELPLKRISYENFNLVLMQHCILSSNCSVGLNSTITGGGENKWLRQSISVHEMSRVGDSGRNHGCSWYVGVTVQCQSAQISYLCRECRDTWQVIRRLGIHSDLMLCMLALLLCPIIIVHFPTSPKL